MNRRSTFSRFATNRTSIWASFCFGFGLWTVHIDGYPLRPILMSALTLAAVMIDYFASQVLWRLLGQKRSNRNRS